MKFTDTQLEAIGHITDNLQLIACAGSGKTEVIARRVVTLLKNGIKPGNVIAFTFTEKAAAELKERIMARCNEELGEVHGMAEMYIGTIHGFCLDLLINEVHDLLKYNVLNEVQQTLFIDRHSKASGLTTCTDLSGVPLKRYQDTQHYLSALNIMREDTLDKKLLGQTPLPASLKTYQSLLGDRKYFDYSEILSRAVEELASNATLREHLGKRVKHVIVDEYQDVNPIQESVVRALHQLGAKLCVVGDDDQTIYQWRGSDVENILTFQKRYPKVHQIRLEENFRSSEGIIETARPFIEQNTARLPKKMKPAGAQPTESGDICALQFDSPEAEAQHIVATAKALHGIAFKEPTKADRNHERGLAWSDMAILLRSVARNANAITTALGAADIPYVIVGMNNLFSTGEAIAARELFYFLASRPTSDDTSVLDAWMNAKLGLSASKVKAAIANAKKARSAFDNPTERFSFYSIQRTFLNFLEEACVREALVPGDRGEVVFYNLGKFSQLITDFETIHYHSKPKEKYETFSKFLE